MAKCCAPERSSTRGACVRVVAIEGPSLAGKSTFIRALKARLPQVTVFPCYVDALDPAAVPAVNPGSTAGQLAAFRAFSSVERSRVDAAETLPSDSLVLLDRSIDTLLAHAYSVDQLHGYRSLPAIVAELERHPFLTPDLAVYVDTPPSTLTARLKSRAPSFPSELVDLRFLALFREHFTSDARRSRSVVFHQPPDGTQQSGRNMDLLVQLVQENN